MKKRNRCAKGSPREEQQNEEGETRGRRMEPLCTRIGRSIYEGKDEAGRTGPGGFVHINHWHMKDSESNAGEGYIHTTSQTNIYIRRNIVTYAWQFEDLETKSNCTRIPEH
jgi:hypothetical protein